MINKRSYVLIICIVMRNGHKTHLFITYYQLLHTSDVNYSDVAFIFVFVLS